MAVARRAPARDDIIRLVHRTTGVDRFARDVKRVVERVVPFDGIGLMTVDPVTLLPTSHFVDGRLTGELIARLFFDHYAPRLMNAEPH